MSGDIHSIYVVDNLVSGTITAPNQTVQIAMQGHQSCAAVITGTWTGYVTFQASSDDGATWFNIWTTTVTTSVLTYGLPNPLNQITASREWVLNGD